MTLHTNVSNKLILPTTAYTFYYLVPIHQSVTFIITSKLCMQQARGLTHKSPLLLLSLYIHARYYWCVKDPNVKKKYINFRISIIISYVDNKKNCAHPWVYMCIIEIVAYMCTKKAKLVNVVHIIIKHVHIIFNVHVYINSQNLTCTLVHLYT